MGWNHQPGHLNTKQLTTAIYPKPKGEEHDFLKQKEPDIVAFFLRHSVRFTWIHEKVSSFLLDAPSNQTNDPPNLRWQKCPQKYLEFVCLFFGSIGGTSLVRVAGSECLLFEGKGVKKMQISWP